MNSRGSKTTHLLVVDFGSDVSKSFDRIIKVTGVVDGTIIVLS